MDDLTWTIEFLQNIAPRTASVTLTPQLLPDEAHWFRKAIELQVISVGDCRADCPRRRRWSGATVDEFLTPAAGHRHLFSLSESSSRMNRECIPQIAAVARAILHFGFQRDRYSLSLYRTFLQDYVNKTQGESYETDAEFYAADGSVLLHVEAKRTPAAVNRIAQTIEHCRTFADLPTLCQKELEYVLDVAPKYLWLVSPGCVDPEQYVYAVRVQGKQAEFSPIANLAAIRGV